MVFFENLVLVLAALLALLLTMGLRWRHPAYDQTNATVMFLVIVLALTMLAGGLWAPPVGPLLWGAPWFTFLIIGIVVASLRGHSSALRRINVHTVDIHHDQTRRVTHAYLCVRSTGTGVAGHCGMHRAGTAGSCT